jgi:hypothetical protein
MTRREGIGLTQLDVQAMYVHQLHNVGHWAANNREGNLVTAEELRRNFETLMEMKQSWLSRILKNVASCFLGFC